jgi:hypothetical protein
LDYLASHKKLPVERGFNAAKLANKPEIYMNGSWLSGSGGTGFSLWGLV